ncbi:MAG: hypothetical protein VR73_00725 [Gammaproteobacteria bacterium BRH_c0]|nr:MAG: hypothetical protein VR73_00725 [Gammaproteobacteria bacterium BRH_c0]
MIIKKALYTAVLSALSVSVAMPTIAQGTGRSAGITTIEEIVVTARKREEGLQSVPIAVTVMDTDALREKSIENPYDLTTHVPGLVVRQGGATRGNVDYFIRGQGATFGSSSGVVTYFNEVPLKSQGYVGNNFQFYDMANVQVLKGPQGTLFGRSSTGGAVVFSPIKPGDELGGYLDVKAGNLGTVETSAALNVPLWEDKLSVRAAFNIQRRDGFTESQSTGQELDERSRESYRLGINFKPTDWLENYTLLQINNVDESSTGAVLIDWNPNYPLLRTDLTIQPLGGFTPQAIGAFFAQPFVTGADTVHQLCVGTALQGVIGFGDIPGCLSTRTQRLVDLRNDLSSEVARVQGGGSIRKNLTAMEDNQQGRNEQIINITTLDIGDTGFLGEVSFKNILGFNRYRKSNLVREFGATRFSHGVVFNNNDLVGFPQQPQVNSRYEKSDFSDDVTTEFQVLGDIDGKHNWMLGYFREKTQSDYAPPFIFMTFNNAFTVPLDNTTFLYPNTAKSEGSQTGYFGQFTADLSDVLLDGLSLTGGLRLTESESEQNNALVIPGLDGLTVGGFTNSTTFEEDAKSWTVSLDYQINADTLVYLAHRRGFKPGGINGTSASANVPGVRNTYDPEILDDVEFGLKADWSLMDMPARTNISLYKSFQDDVQRSEVVPNGTGGVFTQINNIAEAEITGLELEQQLVISEYIQLMLNYAYTDAEYKAWPGFTPNINGQLIANIENPFIGVPEHQATIGARFILPVDPSLGQMSFYAEYYRQSSMWLDDQAVSMFPRKPGYQEGYDNLNLRFDWSGVMGTPVDVGLYVRNAMDDEWMVGANNIITGLGFFTTTYNEPRTYGLQLRYRFGADGQ